MVRAAGSYPAGRWFESDRRYHKKLKRNQKVKGKPLTTTQGNLRNNSDKTLREASFGMVRPLGQAVKTPPFHGGNMGSIPVGVTKNTKNQSKMADFFRF